MVKDSPETRVCVEEIGLVLDFLRRCFTSVGGSKVFKGSKQRKPTPYIVIIIIIKCMYCVLLVQYITVVIGMFNSAQSLKFV